MWSKVAAVGLTAFALAGAADQDNLPAASSATICHVRYSHGLPGPDNAGSCTPGAFTVLTRAQACDGTDRPTLRAAVKREVLTEYRVPNWTGADGEIDHRLPVFLGGLTTPANLWPEPGAIPNRKDRLEFYVYRRVCFSDPAPMRVRTARRVFLGLWQAYYFHFGLDR
jgi:hypothetical protein